MIAQQKSLKVLVIGDICTDIYRFVEKQDRDNPEAPGTGIYNIVEEKIYSGMAANVADGLTKLGINVDTLFPSFKGISKTRYVEYDTGKIIMRIDSDFPGKKVFYSLGVEEYNLNDYAAIVVSDYCKGAVTEDLIRNVAISYSGPVVVDTKKKDLRFLQNFPNIHLKINHKEYTEARGVPEGAIITLGAHGAVWCNKVFPALTSKVKDVCGAGDSFLAGLVYGLLIGTRPIITYGLVNAGISVRHYGTYNPTLEELKQGLIEYESQLRNS